MRNETLESDFVISKCCALRRFIRRRKVSKKDSCAYLKKSANFRSRSVRNKNFGAKSTRFHIAHAIKMAATLVS